MESTLVIKVKYGDTLRRFNACIDENERLDLDIDSLRAKILGLFNFPPDADITLRYIDEDGDVVSLVDDDDLRDVMRQRLKFLRIDVQLSNEEGGKYVRSSGSSTPLRSPRYPLPNINAGIAEALKSVPEPLKEAISKLSVDLASKTASSNPVLAELVEHFSKLGQSFMGSVYQSQSGADANTENVTSETPSVEIPARSKSTFGDSTSKSSQEVGVGDVTRGVGSPVIPASASVDLNLDPPIDSSTFGCGPVNVASVGLNPASEDNRKQTKKSKDDHVSEKSDVVGPAAILAGLNRAWEINRKETKRLSFKDYQVGEKSDGVGKSSILAGSPWFSAAKPSHTTDNNGNPLKECPFSGIPLANDSTVPPLHRRIHPFKRSHTVSDAMGGLFHKGVRCDGCGVHPITGPRFKSNIKEDYDLCSICFAEMGNEQDYIRMDRPVSYRHARLCRGLYDHSQNVWGGPQAIPPVFRSCGMKSGRPKLDSRFISDITVLDGTMMAPSTPFTKIWRMRNNGNFVWPRGTQLVWIGGDKFTDAVSVELEVPENGVPPDGQLDIAVDFTAPELPGRYISYWRMASSSGHKFGQRVWVLIQVDALLQDSVCDNLRGLNLNFPPDCCGSKGPEIIDVNVKPVIDGGLLEPDKDTDSMKPVVNELPRLDQELNFPINDALLVGNSAPASVPPEASSSVSYPVIDMSEATPPGPSFVSYPIVEAPASPVTVNEKDAVEQTLLKELEEMGFKQIDLNKEILRMNEYNLEQSVDDLCGVSDWDPMLEELEEMGFCDTEMNKRLLKKNNGSIKRVVMDLISGQKP